MKQTLAILVAFIAIAAFVSCQKEIPDYIAISDSTITSTDSNLIKTYTEDATTEDGHLRDSFVPTYDAGNRLVSMTSAAGTGLKFIYKYSTGSFIGEIYNGSILSIHELYFLNSASLADSTMQYDNEGDTTTEHYTYNAKKLLSRRDEYMYTVAGGAVPSDSEFYIYDTKGNMLSGITSTDTVTYEYAGNIPNNLNRGVLYATKSPNLPSKQTGTTGGETIVITHTYGFDSKSRLTADTARGSNGDIIIKSYTY